MSKKLICLFLSLAMLLGVCLTACGEKDDQEAMDDISDEASQAAVSLAVYLMSEKPVDDETVAMIEDAVNKITETRFKTRLKLYYYTEDEYYAKLDAAFAERADRKANGTLISSKQESETGEDETTVNEYGIVEISYPKLTDYQVDIFYMGGKDMFDKYSSQGMLTKLDDEINSASKELTTNIPPQLLAGIKKIGVKTVDKKTGAVKHAEGTYAIPTSKPIGEYTYLLLNKHALEVAYRRSETGSTTYSEYTSLTCDDVKDFIEFVAQNEELAASYYPLYTPYSSTELLDNINNLQYWGVDENGELSDALSVLGGYFNNGDDYLDVNKYAKLENLFENEQFLNDLRTIKYYEQFTSNELVDGKDFAVGYVTGGKELVETYGEDYELIPVGCPRLTEDELYADLFAVCDYTSNVGRSMKILTLLNTDVEFRNLILYGIEGEHYQLVDTGVDNEYGEDIMAVERFETGESKYMMDVNKTGNTLIAHPLVGESATLNHYGIIQNQEAKTSLSLGFDLDVYGFEADAEGLQAIRTLSKEIFDAYEECAPEAIEAFISQAKAKIDESEAVKNNLSCQLGETAHEKDGTVSGKEDRCHSLYCCYTMWLKEKKIIK